MLAALRASTACCLHHVATCRFLLPGFVFNGMCLQAANAGNRKRADDALAGHVTVVTRGEAQLAEVLADAGMSAHHLCLDATIANTYDCAQT